MSSKTIYKEAEFHDYWLRYGLGFQQLSLRKKDFIDYPYDKNHWLSDRPLAYYEYYTEKYYLRYCEHEAVIVDPNSYIQLKAKYPNRNIKFQNTCYNGCRDKLTEFITEHENKQSEPEIQEHELSMQDNTPGVFGEAMGTFLSNIDETVDKRIDGRIDQRLDGLKEMVEANRILVVKNGESSKEVHGLKHNKLEDLFTFCANNIPTLLVGPPGTGKSAAGQQVAEGFDVQFEAMSVGMQTSKSDILGFIAATGEYIQTGFRRAFEEGGVFLMDEIDAGNSNVLIVLNTALSNDFCQFPDKMVKRHADFKFIGTANTYGNGATQNFVGRNQLDAATLDRFAIIDWDIDPQLEKNLASAFENGPKWHEVILNIRDYAGKNIESSIVSPRATLKGARLLDAGIKVDDVISATLLGQIPTGSHGDITKRAKEAWSKATGSKPSGGTTPKAPTKTEVAW